MQILRAEERHQPYLYCRECAARVNVVVELVSESNPIWLCACCLGTADGLMGRHFSDLNRGLPEGEWFGQLPMQQESGETVT